MHLNRLVHYRDTNHGERLVFRGEIRWISDSIVSRVESLSVHADSFSISGQVSGFIISEGWADGVEVSGCLFYLIDFEIEIAIVWISGCATLRSTTAQHGFGQCDVGTSSSMTCRYGFASENRKYKL